MVPVCQDGHRDPQTAMDEVRRNATVPLLQTDPGRGRAPSHAGVSTQNRPQGRRQKKKLVGTLFAQKLLLYAPLLRWYVKHGAVITAVYTQSIIRHQNLSLVCRPGDRGPPYGRH